MCKSGDFYVYGAYGINGELLYIGKGRGSRLRHCNSGASQNKDLNRYYFANGEDSSMTVKIIKSFSTDKDALLYEAQLISELQPEFNKALLSFPEKSNLTDMQKIQMGYSVDYARLMKQYIKALEVGDVYTIDMIANYSEEHKRHVDVLGVDKIRAIGVNKTKITNAYNLKLKFNESNTFIKQSLSGLTIGNRYTIDEIKERLQLAYDKVDIKKPPKGVDIKNFFSVKDVFVTRDGKRHKGFLILDDLYKEII